MTITGHAVARRRGRERERERLRCRNQVVIRTRLAFCALLERNCQYRYPPTRNDLPRVIVRPFAFWPIMFQVNLCYARASTVFLREFE